MFARKLPLTLVIICKLCFAFAPLVLLCQPAGEMLQPHVVIERVADAVADPQPGGLRRLFGRRLLGQ